MAGLPPLVTARDLLNEVVDVLQVKLEASSLGEQCDCEYMRLLTDTSNPYPHHLVIGGDYLSWVSKYAFYHSMGLGMKTAVVCVESKPLTNLLALIALGSGIPQDDLFSLQVCRQHFAALNRGLEQVWVTNPVFCESSLIDLNGLISLIRHLKRHQGIETVIVDALHQVRSEGDKPTTRADQRLISSVLQSTAHVGHFHIIAGYFDPNLPFPNLPADSAFYCDSGQPEATKAEPKRIAIACLATASTRWIRASCSSLFRRIVALIKQD